MVGPTGLNDALGRHPQGKATQEQSKSGRPMFGDSLPLYGCAGCASRGFLTGAPWEGHRGAGRKRGGE
jgi:hypothetical protein